MLIYTAGFPNRAVKILLEKIARWERREGQPTTAIAHWGDMDYGGICIFEYLRANFCPSLTPFRMDEATFLRYASHGRTLEPSMREKLEALLSNDRYAEWHNLLRCMLQHGKRVEQEIMLED